MTSVGTTRRLGGLIGVLWLAPACTPDVPTASPIVGSIAPVATNLVVYPDPLVAETLAVRVADAQGRVMAGVTVHWEAQSGASVTTIDSLSAADGTARAVWRPGEWLGRQKVYALVDGLPKATIAAEARSFPLRHIIGGSGLLCGIGNDDALYCLERDVAKKQRVIRRMQNSRRYSALSYSATEICGAVIGGGVDCLRPRDTVVTPKFDSPAFVKLVGTLVNDALCGLTATGEAWCWGSDDRGRFGDGATGLRTVPIRMPTELRFSDLALGTQHGCGVTLEWEVWCWGDNRVGQLGLSPDTTALPRLPIKVPNLGTTKSVMVGYQTTTCAHGTDALVRCWGSSGPSILGIGLIAQRPGLPVTRPVDNVRTVTDLSGTDLGYAVLGSGSQLYSWGYVRGGTGQVVMSPSLIPGSDAAGWTSLVPTLLVDMVCGETGGRGMLCAEVSGTQMNAIAIPSAGPPAKLHFWAIPAPTP